jgi:hypothetical protein
MTHAFSCLTVWRPWDYALVNGKDIENRPTRPPAALIGQRIALHAGLKYDDAGARVVKRGLGVTELPQRTAGVIFAVTTIVGWVEVDTVECRKHDVKLMTTDPELEWAVKSKWFSGPVGIVLKDTVALPKPIPARGMQGWWPLPAHTAALVLQQIGDA